MPRHTTTTVPAIHPHHRRLHDDRGEGIISAAIAVLVMAFLGALMWVGFQTIFQDTQARTESQISQIGG